MEIQQENSLKCVHSGNRGEFKIHAFELFCINGRNLREFTVLHTPRHNGLVKRKIRIVLNAIRSMLLHSGLNAKFWVEEGSTTVYTQNCVSSSVIKNIEGTNLHWVV